MVYYQLYEKGEGENIFAFYVYICLQCIKYLWKDTEEKKIILVAREEGNWRAGR